MPGRERNIRKNRLTQYVRRTKQSEDIVVTKRGKPIVLIQSIQSANRIASREVRLARLAAQGFITLPTRQPLKRVRRARVAGRPISQTILEDRR